MRKPVQGSVSVQVNCWTIFQRALEEGIAYGWRHAHKHDDHPSEEFIREEVLQAVTTSVCEVFSFPLFNND